MHMSYLCITISKGRRDLNKEAFEEALIRCNDKMNDKMSDKMSDKK